MDLYHSSVKASIGLMAKARKLGATPARVPSNIKTPKADKAIPNDN